MRPVAVAVEHFSGEEASASGGGGIGTLPVKGATSIALSSSLVTVGLIGGSGLESSSSSLVTISTDPPPAPPEADPLLETPPWACDWWYFNPLMWRYFLEQFGSGHSINEVPETTLAPLLDEHAVAGGDGSINGLDDPAPLELERARLLTLTSSFLPPPPPLPLPLPLVPLRFPLDAAASLAGLGGAGRFPMPLRRPLAPLRNLLCIGLNDESVRLDRPVEPLPAGTGVLDAPRPLLARPFGALDSASLVGESQNLPQFKSIFKFRFFLKTKRQMKEWIYLGGAQSFLVQSIKVPT